MSMDPLQPSVPTAPVVAPATAGGPTPAPVVAVTPRAKSGGILNLLLIGAALVAIGGVAFAVGRSTAPASSLNQVGALPDGAVTIGPRGSFAPGGGPGGFALGGSIALDGTVTSIDADSLTLRLADGQEMTVKLDGATTYREATDAAAADVVVGDQVSVKAAAGGRVQAGGDGQTPELTAGDVTVVR